MALTYKEIEQAREELERSHRPLIFFDDDCDGLSSFLQVFKFIGDGKGVPVKDSPKIEEKYYRKVREYQPDLVIILDKPYISDEFAKKVKTKILWIDHHDPQHVQGNITYLNPRIHDDEDNRPTSYWLYRILQKNLWISMIGTVGDWCYPEDLVDDFRKEFPGLLPEEITTPEAAIHDTILGKLVRIFSFNLKGTVKDTMASVKTLTRIENPNEILEQTTSKGKYIYKKYDRMISRYEDLLKSVDIPDDNLLVFIYHSNSHSYTSDLSNELLYRHPDKVIIIGRTDNGYVKCSLRSRDVNIHDLLQECLKGVEGKGGGHTNACGAVINEEDFSAFTDCLRQKLKNFK